MLKKITVEDRREMLIAELRKMEGDPSANGVPFSHAYLKANDHDLCALGVICKLWPDNVDWSAYPSTIYQSAAALVGATGEGRDIYRLNDKCKTYPEVADRLEKLFAGLPVGG